MLRNSTMQNHPLVRAAMEARLRAYAPYSQYRVGAASLWGDGRVITGSNVENSSYGLTICAERVAIASAVAGGARGLRELVVATENGGAPCGACRQVMEEFAQDLVVHLVNAQGEVTTLSHKELLPRAFGPKSLAD